MHGAGCVVHGARCTGGGVLRCGAEACGGAGFYLRSTSTRRWELEQLSPSLPKAGPVPSLSNRATEKAGRLDPPLSAPILLFMSHSNSNKRALLLPPNYRWGH